VNAAPTATALWAEYTCEVAGDAAKMLVHFFELVFVFVFVVFVALGCQICAALAKIQPAQPSLRMSSAFPNAGGGSLLQKHSLPRRERQCAK